MSLFKPGYSIVQDKVDVLKTTIGVRKFISHDNQEVQQMKNRRTIKRAALMALALLVVLTLTGCGKEPEMVYTPHDEVKISEGDSIDVTLSNLPEGHEASEFSWTGDFDGDPLTGSVKITKSGKGSVAATLTTRDYFYREVFPYILYPTPEVFRLDQTEIEFVMDLQGMDGLPASYGAELRVDTDVETAGTGMNIEWSSSDPEVMNVGTRTGLTASEKKSMVIAPRKPGVADITAHFGDAEATCHVTVKEKNAEPENVLQVLSDYADRTLGVSGSSAFVSAGDVGCEVEPSGQPGGGGKLAVVVELNMNSLPEDGNVTGMYNYEEHIYKGYGCTSLLPRSVRATSMDEVSQIIRVREGEREKDAAFTGGVQGWVRVVNVERVDALTGEVLQTYGTFRGRLDEHYWVSEGQDIVTSDLPRGYPVINCLYDVIAGFWLEEYDNVSFYSKSKGGTLYRYLGKGTVSIPSELGIKKMNCKRVDDGIAGFEVPDGIEIVYWFNWKDYAFRVAADSPAEKYCRDQEVYYELLNH